MLGIWNIGIDRVFLQKLPEYGYWYEFPQKELYCYISIFLRNKSDIHNVLNIKGSRHVKVVKEFEKLSIDPGQHHTNM